MRKIIYKNNGTRLDIESIGNKGFDLLITVSALTQPTRAEISFKGNYQYGVMHELTASLNNIPTVSKDDLILKSSIKKDCDIFNLNEIAEDYSLNIYFVYTEHAVIVVYSDTDPNVTWL